MKSNLEKYNSTFFKLLYSLKDHSMSLEEWVDRELSLSKDVFEKKYGKSHVGIRFVMEKEVSLRDQ